MSDLSAPGGTHHHEKTTTAVSGWPALVACLACIVGGPITFLAAIASGVFVLIPLAVLLLITGLIGSFGLLAIQPNSSRVLLLFGKYKGTIKESGFFWVNPFYSKKKVSLRVRNFETGSATTPETKNEQGVVTKPKTRTSGRPSKVNDRDGNPIEISAVVVWKVVDTAEALFEVDDEVLFLNPNRK